MLSSNIKKLGEESDSALNNEVAIKIIETFKDNFNALNILIFESNNEMGASEMPDINNIVKDSLLVKQLLKDDDCKTIQDEYALKN